MFNDVSNVKVLLACIAAVSFPSNKQASEQMGVQRSMPGVSKKLGRSGDGVSEKREGVG